MKTIGIVVGSLREKSFNRSIAEHIVSLLPEDYKAEFLDFSNLTFYNQDLDDNPHESWVQFRKKVKDTDALLFVTPEYNRSIPGALKNALDVASRPYGENVWSGKPGGVISVSISGAGGFGANHHLRQALTFLNVYTMQQPEAYIGNVMEYLDDSGKVVNESTQKFLQSYADAFVDWIGKF